MTFRQATRARCTSLLIGLAILSAGCPTAPTRAQPPATPTPTAANVTGSSALKRIDRAALQTMLDRTAQELLVPGAVILIRSPQGELVLAHGTTKLGARIQPGADTYFRIASNTKTMTAALIMQLAQEGKLALDDPVAKYVADDTNGDKINLAEMLEMRSSLYNYTDAPELAQSLDSDPSRVWSAAQLLAIAFKRPPNFAPGKEYEYCNTNYVLLGSIAERVDGKPLAQVMR